MSPCSHPESLCHTVDIIGIGQGTRIATGRARKLFSDTAASGLPMNDLHEAWAPPPIRRDAAPNYANVPTGDIVTVVHGPLDGMRLVDVEWNGITAMMFTIDLRERADLIRDAAGA